MKTKAKPAGESIQAFRVRQGWTVADLAERCGVSARTVEGWEGGRAPSGAARVTLRAMGWADGTVT